MTDVKVSIFLVRSPDDATTSKEEYRAELRDFKQKMSDAGFDISPRMYMCDAVGAGGGFTGEFIIPMIQALSPIATALIVAWVGKNPGRKFRLKKGDTELEASSREDLEFLIAKARELAPVVDPDDSRGDSGRND